jgi:membrane protease YdiL (CAAX protease family)
MTLWGRLPVVGRAVLSGFAVAVAGTAPWAALAATNVKYGSVVPWAVLPAALYLWLFWRWVQGAGWPRSTSEARRVSCRANALSDEVWGPALVAGLLGLATLVLSLRVVNRLVTLPAQRTVGLEHLPLLTAIALVIMGSLVAGVVEESAFRGYMQGPIERRHGPVVAILLTGTLFGFLHFTHPETTLTLMPFYLAVAVIYGALAYLTNSILPGVVLHASGNALGAIDLLARGQSEWQASATPALLVWESGPDASFWYSCVAATVVGAAAVRAYSILSVPRR